MGGKHTTYNDMLKAAEINRRKVEAVKREKEKKSRVEYHARREAALPIVNCLMSWTMTLGCLQARSWRFCSGGRVWLHQKWATLQTDDCYINN